MREWEQKIDSLVSVMVLNDGALLRLVDKAKLKQVAESAKPKSLSLGEALRVLPLDRLSACYSFVRVTGSMTGGLICEGQAWYMEEDSAGEPIDVCDRRCADVGHGCE